MVRQRFAKNVLGVIAGVAGILSLTSFAGAANMIGVDFNLGGAADQSPGSAAVVGPYASAGWYNNVDLNNNTPTYQYNPYNPSNHGSPLTLLDSNGATTTAQFGFTWGLPTYNGGSNYSPGYGAVGSANASLTANQQLYNGSANSTSPDRTQQVTISDIPYATYDIYVLVIAQSSDVNPNNPSKGCVQIFDGGLTPTATPGAAYWFGGLNQGTIPASGFSYLQATSTDSSNPTMGANYVLFSGLTSSIVTLDVSSPGGINYTAGVYFGGIQIVEAGNVPEPATLGLLAVGGLMMLKRRRHA